MDRINFPKEKGEISYSHVVDPEGKNFIVTVWELWPESYRVEFCKEDDSIALHLYDRRLKCMVGEAGADMITFEEWLESRGLTEMEFLVKFGGHKSIHVEALMERGQYVFRVPGENVVQGIEYKDGRIRILEHGAEGEKISESFLVYNGKTGVIRGEMNCRYPGLIGWRELWQPHKVWGRPTCAAQCLRVR